MEISYILSAKRTAIGSFQGQFADFSATELGSFLVKDLLAQYPNLQNLIEEIILGCVLSAGLGQAPARQVALNGGLPVTTKALTINKVCSSGLMSVVLATQKIALGDVKLILAGGSESMSQAPHLLKKLRSGVKLGNTQLVDSILHDGLWDVYSNQHMGMCGELCAEKYQFSRLSQDKFAEQSYTRALEAIKLGFFKNEIAPIEIIQNEKSTILDQDQEPGKAKLEKFASLKPAFKDGGTITAANASSLSDGAALLLIGSEAAMKETQLKPLAKIICSETYSQEPEWFTTAPIKAVKNLLKKAKLEISEVDLFEVNEAFSSVALAFQKELNIDNDKLNITGGAVALGHPIGSSGARILVTLCHNLIRTKKRYGVAAICNGGGEATAILIENLAFNS